MQVRDEEEARAVARLIAQIDSIDAWRERVGRRVVLLFAGTFVFALALLVWVAISAVEHPPAPMNHPGPKVPAVLKSSRA